MILLLLGIAMGGPKVPDGGRKTREAAPFKASGNKKSDMWLCSHFKRIKYKIYGCQDAPTTQEEAKT